MSIEQDFVIGEKVLITGVSGQIGRGLAHVLSKNNEIHGVARFSNDAVREELATKCRELYALDLSEAENVSRLPKDFDVVFHTAVQWGTYDRDKRTWQLFVDTMRVNSFLTGRLMMHLRDSRARIVFGSTGGLYVPSKDKDDRNREGETSWEAGGSIYEDTKMGNDIIIRWLSEDYGIPCTIVRYYWPATPYRPWCRIGWLTKDMMAGKPVKVSQTSPWWQSIGYVSDLVRATAAAANVTNAPADIYNVTGEDVADGRATALAIGEELGVEPILEELEEESDHDSYVADISRMKKDLWAPRIGHREAVRRLVKAIREEITEPQDWMFE